MPMLLGDVSPVMTAACLRKQPQRGQSGLVLFEQASLRMDDTSEG